MLSGWGHTDQEPACWCLRWEPVLTFLTETWQQDTRVKASVTPSQQCPALPCAWNIHSWVQCICRSVARCRSLSFSIPSQIFIFYYQKFFLVYTQEFKHPTGVVWTWITWQSPALCVKHLGTRPLPVWATCPYSGGQLYLCRGKCPLGFSLPTLDMEFLLQRDYI